MFGVAQILVSPFARRACAAAALALLAACGQKGPLFLPTGEAAAGRATLPETLQPAPSTSVVPAAAASRPATGTAAPVRNP
ncbi:MAG TPA: lipoprotein [Ramlibacter sp.]|jgi:predicted small lipoprotein YifL|nr:lipoprotein [Ramlibacter sp.]